MDQVTQQNAALVEQATAAADSMQEQAGKLAQLERLQPDCAVDPGRFARGTALRLLAMARHVASTRLVPQANRLGLASHSQAVSALVGTFKIANQQNLAAAVPVTKGVTRSTPKQQPAKRALAAPARKKPASAGTTAKEEWQEF